MNLSDTHRTSAAVNITRRRMVILLILGLVIGCYSVSASDYPEAEISNGIITAKLYLPDAEDGYYQSTRFDWSGAVYSLQYKGHEYYGHWYDRVDPDIVNWRFIGSEIVSGPCSALCGPVNEFEKVLGWEEAKPGETFIKIGVGVLRKEGERYNRFAPYEVLDPGKWTVKTGDSFVEFTQELSDPKTGYAYVYQKVVRLVEGKPEMVIEHSLKNTGRLAINSDVYNHNFIVLDKQPPGPNFTFKVPYKIEATQIPDKNMAEVQGNSVVYHRPLSGEDEVVVLYKGFSDKAEDAEIVIENKKVGAGLKIKGDHPLINNVLWSIRSVLSIEPYIAVDIEPGDEFTWNDKFEYYTFTPGN